VVAYYISVKVNVINPDHLASMNVNHLLVEKITAEQQQAFGPV
jgi:hypothetical protein